MRTQFVNSNATGAGIVINLGEVDDLDLGTNGSVGSSDYLEAVPG
jgi:hypothetical protein